MNKDVHLTRRMTDFATMLRNMSDKEVNDFILSGKVQWCGLPWSIADMILASRLHCKPDEIKRYRIDNNIL